MTSKYKAMIFDMDGTILDSMWYWRTIWREYVEANHIPMPPELEGQTQYGCGKACHILGAQIGKTYEEVLGEMMVFLKYHYEHDTVPKPHAEDYLKMLKDAGYAVCVATATPKYLAVPALERHGLTKYLDFVTDTEEMNAQKSQPDYFLNVAQKIGVKPEECVMFEDAVYAIRGAKAAGMNVCAIDEPISHSDKDEIMSLADRYITSWAELLDGSDPA